MVDYVPNTQVFTDGVPPGLDALDVNPQIAALTELNEAPIVMTQSAPGQPYQPASQKADTSKTRIWIGYDSPETQAGTVLGDKDMKVVLT